MVNKSGSHKRLDVFRRICPSPPMLFDEMDSDRTISERPTENTGNGAVETETSAMCLQQQPAQNANGSTHLSTQETNGIVDTELPNAFMDLDISRQNERPIFSLGSSLSTERIESLRVRTNEGIVQNPNSNHLTATNHHNGISEINRVNSRDDLPSPSYFLPKDLLDEINGIATCPPTTTDSNQYTLNMPTMAQQPITVPGSYATEFAVPYSESRPMNVKPQSNLLSRMNFSNEFYEQWNNINQQQTLMGTMTFSREFYEQWNQIQQTLVGRMDFSSEFYEQLTNINQLPPNLMGSMDFTNEFYQQWNNINQSQSTIPNNLSFPNEFYEQMFAGSTNQPQQMLLDRTNFCNEYLEPKSTNDSTLNYGNFCNEFAEPRTQNEIHLPQPSNMHHMNSFNGLTELDSWDKINLPQPPFMNSFNGFAELSAYNNTNLSQPTSMDHMNSFNGLAANLSPLRNKIFPQQSMMDHINSFNELATELSPLKNMNVPQPPLTDQMNLPQLPLMNSFNAFNGLSQLMSTNFSTQFLEPRQANLSEPTIMDPMNFSNGFLDPRLINPMNFSQPTLFDYANFYNEFTGAGFTNTFNQQPNELDFMNSLMLHMQNLAQNNVNSNTQWPIFQNPLQYYMNLAGENSFLHNTMPRPILSGNYHDEVWTPDLLRNSNADEINFTADYTTEYSMTHAIAAPTMSHITPTDTYTECQFVPSIPRPILNRSHLNESAEPYEPRSSLNALAEPYEPQNHTMDHVKTPAYPYTESLHLLPVPRPILNRNIINDCSTSYVSPNPGLDQSNYANPNPHFLQTPISDQMNSQNGSIIPQNCAIAQRNVMPDCAHSEESPIFEVSELSPIDDTQQS